MSNTEQKKGGWRTNKWIRAAIPALLLHCSIGTVYCWSIFSQEIADYIGSTAEIIDYATQGEQSEFIICTEDGVEYKLEKDNSEKKFYFPSPRPCCEDMKLNTLSSIYSVLKYETNEVHLSEDVRLKAQRPLDRMLELGR